MPPTWRKTDEEDTNILLGHLVRLRSRTPAPQEILLKRPPWLLVRCQDLLYPPLGMPLVVIQHSVHSLAILPVLGIPARLLPVDDTHHPLGPRWAGDHNILESEVAMREAHAALVWKELAIRPLDGLRVSGCPGVYFCFVAAARNRS